MKLCYVREPWAYFTDRPLSGPGCQWGDDWDDAPYEHNAGDPYDYQTGDPKDIDGRHILKVAYDGDLETPSSNFSNSPYSVDRINSGAAPWLVTPIWFAGDMVAIRAGTSFTDFVTLVHKAGGKVYCAV